MKPELQTSLAAVRHVHGRVTSAPKLMFIVSTQPTFDALHWKIIVATDRATAIKTTTPTARIETLLPFVEVTTAQSAWVDGHWTPAAAFALKTARTILI